MCGSERPCAGTIEVFSDALTKERVHVVDRDPTWDSVWTDKVDPLLLASQLEPDGAWILEFDLGAQKRPPFLECDRWGPRA